MSRVRGNARNLLRRATRGVQLQRLRRVANFVRERLNGNLRLGSQQSRNLHTWSWQGGSHTYEAGATIDLTKSRASLNLGVLFNLDITNWRLQSAQLAVQGAASVTPHATVRGSREWSAQHTLELIPRTSIGAVSFLVGPVPFRIEGQISLECNLEAGARGGAEFGAGITATSNVQLGIAFRNGNWETNNNRNWHHEQIPPTFSAKGTGDFGVSITPKVQVTAHWIGGPTVAIVPYLAAHANVGVETGGTTRCDANAGWGLDATIGARLDLQNPATGRSLGCNGCTRTLQSATVFSTGTQTLWERRC